MTRFAKIFVLKLAEIIEKISCDRCVYESPLSRTESTIILY